MLWLVPSAIVVGCVALVLAAGLVAEKKSVI